LAGVGKTAVGMRQPADENEEEALEEEEEVKSEEEKEKAEDNTFSPMEMLKSIKGSVDALGHDMGAFSLSVSCLFSVSFLSRLSLSIDR